MEKRIWRIVSVLRPGRLYSLSAAGWTSCMGSSRTLGARRHKDGDSSKKSWHGMRFGRCTRNANLITTSRRQGAAGNRRRMFAVYWERKKTRIQPSLYCTRLWNTRECSPTVNPDFQSDYLWPTSPDRSLKDDGLSHGSSFTQKCAISHSPPAAVASRGSIP